MRRALTLGLPGRVGVHRGAGKAAVPCVRFLRSKAPGSAALDWGALGFAAVPTNGIIRYDHLNGAWDDGVFSSDPRIPIHLLSHALNMGQSIFEGLKAFHCADGRVRVFNPQANYARLCSGSERMVMPVVPRELFMHAIDRAVRENMEFVPPYGSGGALYIRPVLFGHGPQLALGPAPQYTFAVAVAPVGAYYQGALAGVDALVQDEYDRAATRGIGAFKAAGNYLPDVLVSRSAQAQGYAVVLYLDSATQRYVEVRAA